MKRILRLKSICLKAVYSQAVCLLIAAAVFCTANVQAAYADSGTSHLSLSRFSGAYVLGSAAAKQPDMLTQLKSKFMPQLNEILTSEQEMMFEEAISGGDSFRRTFKNLMLTSEQKREIKTVLSTVPKRDLFASMTPMQKKELFMKKKEAYMPSSDEIIERINDGMPLGESVSEELQTKIETKIKKRDELMPSSETIMEKIEAGIENVKESFDD